MNQSTVSGIVLYHKMPGRTSFQSLAAIKKALGTKKLGHTGTLDSFAEGLLVVCVGSLTRLAGRITEFDKEYVARILFGSETDTLDPTGTVTKSAPLPSLAALELSIKKFTGNIMQRPPEFSAIKIGGKRASDLTRAGKAAEIPARPVTVYESELLETKTASDSASASISGGEIEEARVRFKVSKGTYIRSLARDIGADCGSAAHLIELFRSRVGNFRIEDAVCLEGGGNPSAQLPSAVQAADGDKPILHPMSRALSVECGFVPLTLLSGHEADFYNGRPLRASWFEGLPTFAPTTAAPAPLAVFTESGVFAGLVHLQGPENPAAFGGAHLKYDFVLPKEAAGGGK